MHLVQLCLRIANSPPVISQDTKKDPRLLHLTNACEKPICTPLTRRVQRLGVL